MENRTKQRKRKYKKVQKLENENRRNRKRKKKMHMKEIMSLPSLHSVCGFFVVMGSLLSISMSVYVKEIVILQKVDYYFNNSCDFIQFIEAFLGCKRTKMSGENQ